MPEMKLPEYGWVGGLSQHFGDAVEALQDIRYEPEKGKLLTIPQGTMGVVVGYFLRHEMELIWIRW